jgi:cell division protein ZapA
VSESVPVSINILEKEYVVSCPAGEEESLRESARILGERMASARDGGKSLGPERVAVVTALNVIHEHLSNERVQVEQSAQVTRDISRLEEKISGSLGRRSGTDRVG